MPSTLKPQQIRVHSPGTRIADTRGDVMSTTRVLHRFTKPDGHWAEIREPKVMQFNGIEYVVVVDGSMLGSELFHTGRAPEYAAALSARIKQFTDRGWVPEPLATASVN